MYTELLVTKFPGGEIPTRQIKGKKNTEKSNISLFQSENVRKTYKVKIITSKVK